MTYHHGGMGNEAETQTGTWRGPGPNPFASGTAPVGADMPIREVQLRLIRAGKSIAADGAWGAKTRGALESFARARGIALPSFGTRGDYKLMGNKVRMPLALATALPEPASGAATRPRSQPRTPAPSALPSAEPSAPPAEELAPPPPMTEAAWYESDTIKAALPWTLAAVVGVAGFLWWKRRSAAA
jgi:peptidoglycan hydrolase-like protein with peptidoglycan-binding domain